MVLLIIGITAVLIVLIAVLAGQHLARHTPPTPEQYDIHAVLDDTGDEVLAIDFAAQPLEGPR